MSHTTSPTQAILLLEDGTVHYGKAFGKKGTTSGEICFNTGMTGYQEVFTDPSYYGQVLIDRSDNHGAKQAFEAAVRIDGSSPGGRDAMKRLRTE